MNQIKTKYYKGFCPTLKTPIFAADGLLIRLRPYMDFLQTSKLISLCDLSEKYGSGIMELTNRGSIQIRGIKANKHKEFVKEIYEKKIIDRNENYNKNISINPFWNTKDKNFKIYNILAKLKLPKLPEKFGFIIDIGKLATLRDISADIRIESTDNNEILVLAEGSEKGKIVKLHKIGSFLFEMVKWFLENKNQNIKRMTDLLSIKRLPESWSQTKQIRKKKKIFPKNTRIGQILGFKLGRFEAKKIKKLLFINSPSTVRFTPFKMIILENVSNVVDKNFIISKQDPLLNISACSGKNFCLNSSINTFKLAKKIKKYTNSKVHVTGCEKNCGLNKDTKILLSGSKNKIEFINNKSKKLIFKRDKISDFTKKLFKEAEKYDS